MIDWALHELSRIETLIKAGIGVTVIFAIGQVWHKTKALVPVVTTVILGGAVMWFVAHTDWVPAKIQDETNGAGGPRLAAVVVVDLKTRTALPAWVEGTA